MGFNVRNGGLGVASGKFADFDAMSTLAIYRTLAENRYDKQQTCDEQL